MDSKSNQYLMEIGTIIEKIRKTQGDALVRAATVMADSIASGHVVHVFGSGHSVLPAMDVFPRYGSFVGLHPLLDPRLMWFTVLGSGGVQELLWLERQEGYVTHFLERQGLGVGDTVLLYSHGGVNAAAIEAGLEAKARGLSVIAVTSMANAAQAKATHSSGRRLADVADIVIDNCVPPQDALISIEGEDVPVAAGSTVAVVSISMALVAETASQLAKRGHPLDVYVSPNVQTVDADHNLHVHDQHEKLMRRLPTGH
jgi:uncharacterized phosphosugar-binding protein